MEVRKITGMNLKRLRESQTLTQEELAVRLTELDGIKVGKQGISALENGKRPVTDKMLGFLCEILSCNPEELYKVDYNHLEDVDRLLLAEIAKMGRACKAELYSRAVSINTRLGRGEQ